MNTYIAYKGYEVPTDIYNYCRKISKTMIEFMEEGEVYRIHPSFWNSVMVYCGVNNLNTIQSVMSKYGVDYSDTCYNMLIENPCVVVDHIEFINCASSHRPNIYVRKVTF